MAKRVSAAQAKAQFSELVAKVALAGEHYIIERRGKPVAAIVSVSELERIEQERPTSNRSQGALAIVGAWREIEDKDVDTLVANIYAERERDTGRAVEIEE